MKTTKKLIYCAIFAALTAVLSQISLPIGPVPINMATISVFVAGGLLGAYYGALSQIVYAALGAVGLPVFAGFSGGFARLIGPTGGYILAYIAVAFFVGFITQRMKNKSYFKLLAVLIAGCIVVYLFGTVWYCFVMQAEFIGALAACVIPFIPGDIAKALLCAFLIKRLHPVINKK